MRFRPMMFLLGGLGLGMADLPALQLVAPSRGNTGAHRHRRRPCKKHKLYRSLKAWRGR